MATWIGLVGVIVGALVAFGGQYLHRRSEIRERTAQLLLEQYAQLVALSEDFRNRVWEERHGLTTDAVANWDLQAYRMAEARIRILCRNAEVLAAVRDLRHSGVSFGRQWRLSPEDKSNVEGARVTHKEAIERFITAASRHIQSRHPGRGE